MLANWSPNANFNSLYNCRVLFLCVDQILVLILVWLLGIILCRRHINFISLGSLCSTTLTRNISGCCWLWLDRAARILLKAIDVVGLDVHVLDFCLLLLLALLVIATVAHFFDLNGSDDWGGVFLLVEHFLIQQPLLLNGANEGICIEVGFLAQLVVFVFDFLETLLLCLVLLLHEILQLLQLRLVNLLLLIIQHVNGLFVLIRVLLF